MDNWRDNCCAKVLLQRIKALMRQHHYNLDEILNELLEQLMGLDFFKRTDFYLATQKDNAKI